MTASDESAKAHGAPRPLVGRVVLVNAAVVAVVLGAALILRLRDGGIGAAAAAGLVVAGLTASVVANFFVIGVASRVLEDLQDAMDTMHKGSLDCHVDERRGDGGLRRLTISFNAMCQRLGRESLSYAERQLGGVEEERKRIGRELHDETSQTLAATLVRLDLCDQAIQDNDAAGAHAQVVSCKTLVAHTMDEIKLIVYDLRPVMLDDFGLVPTLRWYIQSHLQGAGPEVVTDFDEADLRLPGDVETALYRVTQEALANAVRHSDATKVHVRLVTKPGFVSLAVIDNGRGFDQDAALRGNGHAGVGLLSIKERVELAGGSVNIESTVGRGTRLYVVIPLGTEERGEEMT